jgi:hypothetical protein
MARPSAKYTPHTFEERAAEKQRSRDEDARALATGAKSRDDLRRENHHLRAIAHDPIQWDKTNLI